MLIFPSVYLNNSHLLFKYFYSHPICFRCIQLLFAVTVDFARGDLISVNLIFIYKLFLCFAWLEIFSQKTSPAKYNLISLVSTHSPRDFFRLSVRGSAVMELFSFPILVSSHLSHKSSIQLYLCYPIPTYQPTSGSGKDRDFLGYWQMARPQCLQQHWALYHRLKE